MTDIVPYAGGQVTPGFGHSSLGQGERSEGESASFTDLLASLLVRQPRHDEAGAGNGERNQAGQRPPENIGEAWRTRLAGLEWLFADKLNRVDSQPCDDSPHVQSPKDAAGIDREAQSFLGDGSRLGPRLARIAHSLAEIFNEFGLLHERAVLARPAPVEGEALSPTFSGQTLGGDTGSPTSHPSERVRSATTVGEDRPSSADAELGRGADRPSTGSKPSRSAAARSLRLATAQATASATEVSAFQAEPVEEMEPAPAAAGGKEPQALELAESVRSDHSSDALLILEMAEQGLRLAARTGRLTEEQRERLREAIANLLASHGFRPAEIRLNGVAGLPRRPMNEGDV